MTKEAEKKLLSLREAIESIVDEHLPKALQCYYCDREIEFHYERDKMVDELRKVAELWQVKERQVGTIRTITGHLCPDGGEFEVRLCDFYNTGHDQLEIWIDGKQLFDIHVWKDGLSIWREQKGLRITEMK